MLKLFVILIFWVALVCNLWASDDYYYKVERISNQLGLSQNRVNDIERDHLGYIWIGTTLGLNRYDGFEIKKYFADLHSSSTLYDNFIRFVHEDNELNLWVGTINGLNKYDATTDKFNRIKIDGLDRGFSSLLEMEEHLVFLSDDHKPVVYSKKSGEFNFLNFYSKDKEIDHLANIISFAKWNSDKFLALIRDKGFYLIDINSGIADLLLPMSEIVLTNIFTTNNHIFLIDLQKGILKINRNTLEIENPQLAIPYNIVTSFSQHPATKDFWLTTDGSGVFIVDEEFNVKKHLQTGPGIMDILPDNTVFRIFFDAEDVWLGTVRSGLLYLNRSEFEHFGPANGTPYGPADKSILTIHEDKQGVIWLGTDGGGISRFDEETNLFEHFVSDETKKITSIIDYDENRLLVASYRFGLYFFDKRNGSFSSAKNDRLLNQIYSNTRIKLYRDSYNNLWISGAAIWRINFEKNEIRQFSRNSEPNIFTCIAPIFYTMHEDSNGNIWFSSEGGIFCFNNATNRMEHPVCLANLNRSYGRVVYSLTANNKGNILFGSDQGLYMYNTETRIISDILINTESESRIYYTLYISADGRLWAATSEGLFQFKEDGKGNYIPLHHKNSGNFEYRFGSLLESENQVYFGGNEGFLRFNPLEIKSDSTLVQPVITAMRLSGTEHNMPKESIFIPSGTDAAKVSLSYSTSSYEFEFNAFAYSEKNQIKYKYKLQNFEEIWHDGKSRKATYTSLPAGDYVFVVKAANGSGVWNDVTTNLYLNILPRWWQTLLFKIILIAIVLVTSIYIWLESLKTAKLRNQLKLEIVEQEKLKEINQMKLRFYTNISHELKTPLTLIYAPLEQMVRRHRNPEEMKNLLPFLFRNAKRMNQLVSQLLEFRKAEMAELYLNPEETDLVSECREILDYFVLQADYEGIKLIFSAGTEQFKFVCDRDKLFKMLSNLLSNAMKHTSKGGTIELRLLQGINKEAIIKVSDTGSGFPEKEQTKIFDRYYQADHKEAGTGIGLAFTKHLVELHKGTITVESEEGQGSVFTIILPSGGTALSAELPKIEDISVKSEVFGMEESSKNEVQKSDGLPELLIAEDEWELRKYLVQLLSSRFNVITAKNGKDAYNKALQHVPDIIVTDLMMPGMDGFELCQKIKNDLRISHIPVVMLTAKSDLKDKIEGYKAGADAYVSKPFDGQLLSNQIESILRNRSILKERFSHDLDLVTDELSHSSADEKYLHKAISVVETNLANTKFNVNEFVSEMGMSRTLVYTKTKSISGKPVKEFILHIRLRNAANNLKRTNMSITEIANNCGFADPTYFSTVFKRYYSITPSEYRNKP